MPTIRANDREYIEATFSRETVVHGAATGRDVLVDEEWFESFRGSLSPTGFFKCSLHEALEVTLDFGMPKTSLIDVEGYGVFVVVPLKNGMQVLVEPFDYGYVIPTTRASELPRATDNDRAFSIGSQPGRADRYRNQPQASRAPFTIWD